MPRSELETYVDRFKALAHPARLRMLAMLAEGELCVCQLTAVLGLAFSTVSAHLADLKRSGLVGERKEGRWVYYFLRAEEAWMQEALAGLLVRLRHDPQVAADLALCRKIRALEPSLLMQAGLDLEQVGLDRSR